MKKSTAFMPLCLIIFLLAATTLSNPRMIFAQPFEPFSQPEQTPDTATTEEPTTEVPTEEPTTTGPTEEPTTTGPGPTSPGPTFPEPTEEPGPTGTIVSNTSQVESTGGGNATAVGPNATTNTQQTVSSILNDFIATEPDANQTEIAELQEKLPVVVSAINQAGEDGDTTAALIKITRVCDKTYDDKGNVTHKECTTTIDWNA